MLGTDLLKTKAVGFHENSVLPRNPDRDVTKDIVPVTLVSEDVARIGEFFF
jgi:hypothetical protein